MPTKLQIIAALGVFTILQEAVINRPLRTKYEKLSDITVKVYKENLILKEKATYLLHLLEENDIELSDFDLIALTHDILVTEE